MTKNKLDLDLLARLTQTPGLPGREGKVAEVIRQSLPGSGWQITGDRLGNVIAHMPGNGPKVVCISHMDEVGLIVRRITEEGFILVERMGGMGVHAMPGSRLTLWTRDSSIPVLVGILPQHLNNQPAPELVDIYLDAGVTSRQEVLDLGVRVGDGITWDSPLMNFGKNRISGKALDDRLGCLVLIEIARTIQPENLKCDLYLAFIVQEETMLSGGVPVVESIHPDVVIGIDGTLTFDTPELLPAQSDIRLGGGPAVKWMDTVRGKQVSYVPDQNLIRVVQDAAEKAGIPLQDEIIVGISTALAPLPYAGTGIATLALSIPVRYHHTPIETADLVDIRQMVTLLQTLLTQPHLS